MKYEKKLTELQAEQASVGATQNRAPLYTLNLDEIKAYLRGFGLRPSTVDAIAKRWHDDQRLAYEWGYSTGSFEDAY